MALEAWRRLFGVKVSYLTTSASHWLAPELFDVMNATGGGNLPVAPISIVTIGALMDNGYPATWSGAGPYR